MKRDFKTRNIIVQICNILLKENTLMQKLEIYKELHK